MKEKRFVLFVLALTLVVLLVAGCGGNVAVEPPNDDNGEGEGVPVAEAYYIGSESCQGCHRPYFDGWSETLHPAGFNDFDDLYDFALWQEQFGDGPGNPIVYNADEETGITGTKDFILADGTEVKDVDGVFVMYEDGKFVARFLAENGDELYKMDVEVFGHGKTNRQTYVVNVGDGTGNHLLKWQFRKDRNDTWVDRNDDRIWQNNCVGCHTTGYDIDKWEADPSLTAGEIIADIGVGCESCHGPGSEHLASPTKDTIINPADLTKKQQFDTCTQCHTRTTAHKNFDQEYRWGDALGFIPGDKLDDFVEYIVPTWGTAWRRVSADGKGLGDHQMSFDLQLGPKADWACSDCHSLHSVNEEGLMLKKSLVNTCVSCHSEYNTPEKVLDAMDGTRGWDRDNPEEAKFRGKTKQHTFRLDAQGRVIGLPEEEWPNEDKWPWQ